MGNFHAEKMEYFGATAETFVKGLGTPRRHGLISPRADNQGRLSDGGEMWTDRVKQANQFTHSEQRPASIVMALRSRRQGALFKRIDPGDGAGEPDQWMLEFDEGREEHQARQRALGRQGK
ncbi:MAG: hypothetical protein A2091_10405 [Desulfuromonadales bacterium GWD2_61_12]|nr:MAG: hypothetical protein A2091_10405 [Desulfuromonadales bacterium GWD2_61_12]